MMTVAELRALIADMDADLPVIVRGGEYDYEDCNSAIVITVPWAEYDEDRDDYNDPQPRRCLALEA